MTERIECQWINQHPFGMTGGFAPLGTSTEPVYGVHLCNSGLPQIFTMLSNTFRPFTTNLVFGTGSDVTLTELNGPG